MRTRTHDGSPDSSRAEQTESTAFSSLSHNFPPVVAAEAQNKAGVERGAGGGDPKTDICMALIIGHSQENLAALLLKSSQ